MVAAAWHPVHLVVFRPRSQATSVVPLAGPVTNCPHQPACKPGKFGPCCMVIGMRGDQEDYRHAVGGKAHAWQVTRKLLARGYAVAWSSALIDVMGVKR